MQIAAAQADLRRAYTDGGPGIIVSALVWFVAGLTLQQAGLATAFAVLFFGGMGIFPAALFLNRVVLARTGEGRDNPFGKLVLESTIAMIAGLFAAYLFLPTAPGLMMPVAAIAVGAHFFVFRTAYGDNRFWLMAAVLTGIGAMGLFGPKLDAVPLVFAFAGAELLFGIWLTVTGLRNESGSAPTN